MELQNDRPGFITRGRCTGDPTVVLSIVIELTALHGDRPVSRRSFYI